MNNGIRISKTSHLTKEDIKPMAHREFLGYRPEPKHKEEPQRVDNGISYIFYMVSFLFGMGTQLAAINNPLSMLVTIPTAIGLFVMFVLHLRGVKL